MSSFLSPHSVSSSQNTHTVHLAHISDPHLPPPHIPWSAFFLNKRLLSALLWKHKRSKQLQPHINSSLLEHIRRFSTVSAIMVSGDITNFGTREEYMASVPWLRHLPATPIVVPGNHDAMVAALPENSFDLWKEWSGDTYPFVRYINHVAIIGLNSAIPTLPFTAYGRVSSAQLLHLDSLLKTLGEQGYCRVIMIHHPPKKGLLKTKKSLLNLKKVSEILRKRGAELVVHGHSHNATVTTVENTDIPLLGVGAASMSSRSLQRRASWNSLLFSRTNNKNCIELTRYDYEGHVMAKRKWVAPLKGHV